MFIRNYLYHALIIQYATILYNNILHVVRQKAIYILNSYMSVIGGLRQHCWWCYLHRNWLLVAANADESLGIL